MTVTANISDLGSGLSGTPLISWYVGNSSNPNWSAYAPMTQGSGAQWSSSFIEPGTGQNLYYQIEAQDVAGNSTVYKGSMSIANNGPVGYWEFNEGSGTTTADSSGNGNNGTLVSSPSWVTGWLNNALEFNGSSSYVNLNDASTTGPLKPALPVTISAWVYLNSTSGQQAIFSSDNFNSTVYAGYDLKIASGVLWCDYGSAAGSGSTYRRSKEGTTVLTTGQWYHVAAVIQGPTTMNLYVNGVDDGGTYNGTGSTTMVYTSASSKIGTDGGMNYFKGTIDDVRVYNRVLSTTEIGLLANGPVSNWRFDEGSGTTALDSGTAGITGTLINSPSYVQGYFSDALSFTGSSYVNLNDASTTGPLKPALPVTISAWIKLSSTSGQQAIFSSDNFNSTVYAGYDLKVASGILWCDYGDAAGSGSNHRRSKEGTTTLKVGQWYHVAAVIQGSTTMNIYVNGVDDGGTYSGTGNTTMGYTSAASQIGSNGNFNYLKGTIDDLRLYNRVLSPTEVETLDSASGGVIPPE